MIEIFQGRIGGGKTYFAIERIAMKIAQGGTIYSNIELVLPGLARLVAKKYGVYMERDAVRELPEGVHGWWETVEWGVRECPVLVIIDEAQVFYNSRDWSRTQSQHAGMLSFLTQSRKACVDVIFVTQHGDNIDKQFRLLAQRFWSFRDLKQVALLSDFASNYFLAVCCDYSGEKQFSKFVKKDKRVYEAYDTLSFLDETMQGLSEGRRQGIPRRKLRRVGLLRRAFGRHFLAELVEALDDASEKEEAA